MKIDITGIKVSLTPLIENYVHKKFSKLEKIYPKIVNCQVVLKHERYLCEADVNLDVKGSFIHAKGEGEDFRGALDEAKAKIIRQLKSYKDKKVSQHRRENSKQVLGEVK